ncbi:MAG TPA: glycosyltransferase [Rudaea sp.]|jgi:glycosyltransferase involved in cell wall biosynthesis|nr:glycosyltransferase [Rudaea sp.]
MRADFDVLHLRSSAGLYGAEYVILGMVPELNRIGIPSRLLSIDNHHLAEQPLFARAQAMGVPAERVPCRGRFDFTTLRSLRDTLRRNPNAILHVHDYKSAFHAWLARGRRRTPIVSTSHGHFPTTANLRMYNRLELALMRRFEHVCVVSKDMLPILARAGIDDKKTQLIENGIDTQRFNAQTPPLARSEFGIADDAVVFGSAMRLTEQKNPLGLIDAFAKAAERLPNAALVIAGDGPLRDAVTEHAREHSVADRVHLIGARNDLERFYPMLDIFVLPSHYEGLPLALLEAMACERGIVATAVGQVPAVLEGTHAAVVTPGDMQSLASAMYDAIRQPRRDALRARVVERYSVTNMTQHYASAYHKIWSEHVRARS